MRRGPHRVRYGRWRKVTTALHTDQSLPAGHATDVSRILDFIAYRGPVRTRCLNEGSSGAPFALDQRTVRLRVLARAFHRDRLARAVANHPGDPIAQPAWRQL